jgi:hypothetical protein
MLRLSTEYYVNSVDVTVIQKFASAEDDILETCAPASSGMNATQRLVLTGMSVSIVEWQKKMIFIFY